MDGSSINLPKSPVVWLFYGLAFVSIIIEPFGYGVVDGLFGVGASGSTAKVLLVVSLFSIGAALHKGLLDNPAAIRCGVASYLVLEAVLCEPVLITPLRLLPLAVLALGQLSEGTPPSPNSDLLEQLPAPLREALAFGLVLAGGELLVAGFGLRYTFSFDRLGFVAIMAGFALCAMGMAVMVGKLTWGSTRKIALGSYAAMVAIALIIQFARIGLGKAGFNHDLYWIDAVITTMLLVQVWRQWHQANAILKIAETFLGGWLVAHGARGFLEAKKALDPFFLIVSGPMLIASVLAILLGLVLIWSSKLWLRRLFPERWTTHS